MALYFFYSVTRYKKLCREKKKVPRSLPSHKSFGTMFPPSICLCNCTSLSDASQHIWYIDKSPLSVFSSWLFPWNVQEKGGDSSRRQAERSPSFPDGLYHIDWLVKYISYHIKPAQGHDSSLGRKWQISQRLLENKFIRCSVFATTQKLQQSNRPATCVIHIRECNSSRNWIISLIYVQLRVPLKMICLIPSLINHQGKSVRNSSCFHMLNKNWVWTEKKNIANSMLLIYLKGWHF